MKKDYLKQEKLPDNYKVDRFESLESQRRFELYRKCQNVPAFMVEGVVFFGREQEAIEEFCKANPRPFSADFLVWLMKNYKYYQP